MSNDAHGDDERVPTRYNNFWIHTVFGHFVKDTLDYFTSYLYPRFAWKVVGTYNKSVEYLSKQIQYGRETDQPNLPALILDPSGDFGLDPTYGKFLYRFPNLAPGMIKYVYKPIYQDQNILITVAFSRLVGEFNFTGIMSSFYEYTDMRIFLNLIFGGEERFIYPQWFNSFIILPPEIVNYEYVNNVTHEHYHLNIEGAFNQLLKTTNTDELVYPCRILPRYKLTGMSDASTRLGGTENLPDWKLGFTVSYEVELPTWIILESDYLVEKMQVNVGYGSCYSENESYGIDSVSVNIDSFDSNIDHGLDSTANSEITYPTESTINNRKSRLFKTRYYHIVTQQEADSTSVVDITIPEPVTDNNLLKLNGKYGLFSYGDHYIIVGTTTLRIYKENVTLEKDDILEIYIYEYI